MSIKAWIKKEITFCIAFIAACLSMIAVPPSAAYVSYIDFRVLFVLFSLMLVVVGLRTCGVFSLCAEVLCSKVKTVRLLSAILVYMCFLFSMFITNDVALLTFVPFAIMLLKQNNASKYTIIVVVLQTIAANLGSMLTPIGNPQNLFLYSHMNMSALSFCSILLPYVLISAGLLALCLLCIPTLPLQQAHTDTEHRTYTTSQKCELAVFIILFLLCLLCVVKIVPDWLTALICAVVVVIIHRSLLAKVDYMLLLTFCAFFIFTGNIAHIDQIKTLLQTAVHGHEFLAAIVASQVISNVPATLLLYPFSTDVRSLLLGVDVGGLGTLVASLASLISYKLYVNQDAPDVPVQGSRYIAIFSLLNVGFMIVLCLYRLIA